MQLAPGAGLSPTGRYCAHMPSGPTSRTPATYTWGSSPGICPCSLAACHQSPFPRPCLSPGRPRQVLPASLRSLTAPIREVSTPFYFCFDVKYGSRSIFPPTQIAPDPRPLREKTTLWAHLPQALAVCVMAPAGLHWNTLLVASHPAQGQMEVLGSQQAAPQAHPHAVWGSSHRAPG